jgi:hypothetical protein
MRSRTIVSLAGLALVAACSQDAITTPVDAASDVGAAATPPPPLLRGRIQSDFTAVPAGARVAPEAGFFHRFMIFPVEFTANEDQSLMVMRFPLQTVPPGAGGIGPISRGDIEYKNGQTLAKGRIFEFDQRNNGFWVVDLTPISMQGNVFVPSTCQVTTNNCWDLAVSLPADFYHIIGTDESGNLIFEVIPAPPSPLRYVDRTVR